MTNESTNKALSSNPFAQWDLVTASKRAAARDEHEDDNPGTQEPSNAQAPQVETSDETTPEATKEETATSTKETPESTTTEEPKTSAEETWEKRYADLRRLDQDRLNKIRDLEKELKETKAAPTLNNLKTDEEIAEFAEANPELYSLFESIALKKAGDVKKTVDELEERQKTLATEKTLEEILSRHPDAKAIKVDPRFKDWYDKQTLRIQDMLAKGDIDDICLGLDKYKADLGIAKVKSKAEAKKEEQAQAAAAVTNGSSGKGSPKEELKQWKESEIHAMPDKQYSKLKPEIDKARREGRIIFDM